MDDHSPAASRSRSIRYDDGSYYKNDVEELVEELRKQLEDLHSGRRIKEAFAEVDASGSGRVTRSEYASALRALRVDMSGKSLDKVFDSFDRSGRGEIVYRTFLEGIGIRL